MSDFRGPITGSGDEPPDVVPRTGPPTGPATQAVAEPVVAADPEPAPEPDARAEIEPTAEVMPDPPGEPRAEPSPLPAVEPSAAIAPPPLPRVIPIAARTPDGSAGSAFAIVPAHYREIPAPAEPTAPAEPASQAFAPAVAQPGPIALAIPLPKPTEIRAAAPSATPPVAVASSVWPRRIKRAVLVVIGAGVGYALLVMALIVAYRWIDPPRSALMITTRLSGQPVIYAPVPLTSISSYLQRAVVTSEDARFCSHRGVDWAALYEAMQDSRGGSTITMQTAKNLFLWSSRSYVRKAIEIPVALAIDAFWPKRRILEVYLNIAEWGPGVFGAEAASYYHFDKPASRLTVQEATQLAATLPNPIARDAGDPGRMTSVLASRLRGRMANSDAFVRCLGLRAVPRAETPAPARPAAKAPVKPPASDQKSWKTTTEPAFNPWKEWGQN